MLSCLLHCPWSHVPQFPIKPPRVLPPRPLLRHLPYHCLGLAVAYGHSNGILVPLWKSLLPIPPSPFPVPTQGDVLLVPFPQQQSRALTDSLLSIPVTTGPGSCVKPSRRLAIQPIGYFALNQNQTTVHLEPNRQPRWQGSPAWPVLVPPGLREGVHLLGVDRECSSTGVSSLDRVS